jgi:hypothetical protein
LVIPIRYEGKPNISTTSELEVLQNKESTFRALGVLSAASHLIGISIAKQLKTGTIP